MSSSTSSTPPAAAYRLNPKAQEFCPRFIVAPSAQVPSPELESVITHTSIRSLSPPPPAPTARYEADTRRIQRLHDWQLGLNNDDEGEIPRLYKVLSPVETWSDTHRMHDYSCQGCQAEYRGFLAQTFGVYEYCIDCIYEARQKYVQKMRAEYKYRPRQRRLLDAFKTQDLVEEVADFVLGDDDDEDDEYFIVAAARYVGTEEDMKELVAWIAALQAQAAEEELSDDEDDVLEKDSPPTSPDASPALATVGTLPPPSSPVASYFGDFLNACLDDAAEPAGVPGWPEPLPAALADPWPPF
ncbi:hypothetical protein EXIGLDRAFT_751921 [Exidia glandulosa HHB12029]|uniref:Uncharacterized protein n=1 Tax=Exidia glandulosa HHB12029 TaxID=1314781 RepID=A0A165EZE3_EXIGL|nr:hypothetical protein EXIGLDRAFT_751921 [Exidia glandulosa HHB12029]